MKVEYVAHSGSDLLVVDCARASFGKQSEWDWAPCPEGPGCAQIPVLSEKDTKLINFLAREKHVLPFRHPTVTLRCKAPLFVARQLMKHQAGMSWSEESRRYITTEPEFYWPDAWRGRADNVKQGSGDEHPDSKNWQYKAEFDVDGIVGLYNAMLKDGVAPELARMVLPQNMMTTWVWTGTLLAWVHMLKLRLDSHTQAETREFASKVADIIKPLYPVSYAALMEG